jgi:hypothetical protein
MLGYQPSPQQVLTASRQSTLAIPSYLSYGFSHDSAKQNRQRRRFTGPTRATTDPPPRARHVPALSD